MFRSRAREEESDLRSRAIEADTPSEEAELEAETLTGDRMGSRPWPLVSRRKGRESGPSPFISLPGARGCPPLFSLGRDPDPSLSLSLSLSFSLSLSLSLSLWRTPGPHLSSSPPRAQTLHTHPPAHAVDVEACAPECVRPLRVSFRVPPVAAVLRPSPPASGRSWQAVAAMAVLPPTTHMRVAHKFARRCFSVPPAAVVTVAASAIHKID